MKDVRIDANGDTRCWNCGSKGLTPKRTFRSKALVGVGALMTKKKLKCQRCGEYNDTGNGKPYSGPAARKYRKEYQAELKGAPAPSYAPQVQSIAEQLGDLAELHKQALLTADEFTAAKAELLGQPPSS